ncbi:HAD family hydrolase [Cohaesibacter celericrescens]|uniref:HAD family hydrolase n=1 Tax=Cohaesibacter celericrescens TaxID=2067669 RepID=UPI0035674E00
MRRFDAVIFDFDGVLVDSELISLSELNRSLEAFGIGKSWEALVDGFLGHSNSAIAEYIEQHSGQNPGIEFPERWAKRIFERFATDLTLIPGTMDLLGTLDAEAIPYCIASGSSPDRLQYSLDLVGLDGCFRDKAYSCDLVAKGKPAPDIFFYAADKLGVSPRNCLVIEDGIAGTVGAKAAEIDHIIGFVGGSHLLGCEDSHAAKLTKSGASHIVRTLAEIETMLSATPA